VSESPFLKPHYAIGPEGPRDWELEANNISLEDLLTAYMHLHNKEPEKLEWFTASNIRLGTMYCYGIHPSASPKKPYDSLWKRERTGGGTVIVAYAEEPETKRVFVGLLWQWRMLQTTKQPVLAVPRGFTIENNLLELPSQMAQKDIENIHLQTALVELKEEMFTGKVSPDMLHRLGPPLNTNNADVDTSGEGEGIYFYGVELPWTCLTKDAGGNLILRSEFQAHEGAQERIVKCQFMLLAEVLDILDDPDDPAVGCALTETAIARLTRYLQRNGYRII
jgi:hypothetical protein